jgi:hypothetical protein
MSRLPGKRARPVLRAPQRSNAPGLPDEIWNGIITRRLTQRGTHASVKALNRDIETFIADYNSDCEPFEWTVTADEIIDKVRSITARMEQLINATEVGDVARQTA